MASSTSSKASLFLLATILFFSNACAISNPSNAENLNALKSFCRTTPYPEVCFNSLKLSISITISPSILNNLLQSLQVAISEATKLSDLFNNAGNSNSIIENKIGAVQDCKELHKLTLSSLKRSLSAIRSQNSKDLVDARTYLSAALTNKETCLESMESASGTLKPTLVDSVTNTFKYVSNTLSMLPRKPDMKKKQKKSTPKWFFSKSDDEGYDPSEVIVVAADGSGNFSTINEAVDFAPSNSFDRTVIYVKEGLYEENVEIPSHKTNIVLLGDGRDATVITGNRSFVDGWTTFRSATLAVSGDGFLARDIAIENKAGPEKHQAVALRVNADLTAFYRCSIYGYQDTLYTHSFRQFYRESDIYGTIDFIFGNAAAIFQGCNIVSLMPIPGQFTVITAQSRSSPDEDTGISIQNSSIVASTDLSSNSTMVKSYLGRPWRVYSRTLYIESYIDKFIDPLGWTKWNNNNDGDTEGLETLYYGEYENYGGGSDTRNRVDWPGFHLLDYNDAYNFTVSEFIAGDAWLGSTSFPYDDGI
ncbi:probable pectinesterase/pectinesterase inhibitor 12 [Arachis duranensis]|uniref:Pectinesterase n=2 Tax=Arachis TaxID=3817 RepID=A0A445EPQ0_ARAHY|nr:probable pectinesterase/pectinesterase inhibitor 12 [Arachis duranensis]XP_025604594.1 probable pectinesterase/pectinesterase inhibitor 12 [Arachis hypogaea]QHO50069.1 putative pectinesterase/pectinesterase inhibitor [Arachis hypogaea]RYR77332.1 hypothetical protein Ahy_A01g001766 [Arachis hypogaea]